MIIGCFAALLLLLAADARFNISSLWYLMVLALYLVAQGLGSALIDSQFFIKTICRGDPFKNAIAITFDDGPIPGDTETILEILKTHHVPAAFFCIGNRVNKNPELALRIHNEGHLLGNHSYNHGKFFSLQSAGKICTELDQTDSAIRNIIGRQPRYFRPPYGVTNPMLASALRQANHITVGWSIRSLDTATKSKEALMKRLTKRLRGGDVILFHDYPQLTKEILPEFLETVKARGLTIERLDSVLNEPAYV